MSNNKDNRKSNHNNSDYPVPYEVSMERYIIDNRETFREYYTGRELTNFLQYFACISTDMFSVSPTKFTFTTATTIRSIPPLGSTASTWTAVPADR